MVMDFLRYVLTNFIFEKLLSHEELVTRRVTAISNNLYTIKRSSERSFKRNKFFERRRQLRLFPKQILCQKYFKF